MIKPSNSNDIAMTNSDDKDELKPFEDLGKPCVSCSSVS